MLTLIFGIWASEPPRAWRTTEKAGPDRVKRTLYNQELLAPVNAQLKTYHAFLQSCYPPLKMD